MPQLTVNLLVSPNHQLINYKKEVDKSGYMYLNPPVVVTGSSNLALDNHLCILKYYPCS